MNVKKSKRRGPLLLRELAHRSRNTFAVAQAIVTLSLADNRAMAADDQPTVRSTFRHQPTLDQLRGSNGDAQGHHRRGVGMLRNKAYSCFRPRGCAHSGPRSSLALIIHELGTNAAKYGALSSPNGVVTINWEMDNKVGSFTWAESGGPATTQPSKVGFGTTLITSLLTPFDGRATLDFRPGGLECHATFSVKQT